MLLCLAEALQSEQLMEDFEAACTVLKLAKEVPDEEGLLDECDVRMFGVNAASLNATEEEEIVKLLN